MTKPGERIRPPEPDGGIEGQAPEQYDRGQDVNDQGDPAWNPDVRRAATG